MSQEILNETKEKMEKTISILKEDLQTVRAGRANPNMLNKVTVNYYGVPTPLKQMANVSVPEPRTLQITPWDKSAVSDVEKAILVADLGFNPTNDGTNIRINIPQLTEERRNELKRQVQKMGEESKVSIRNIRRDANDQIKEQEKNSELSEDASIAEQDEIQEITDKSTKEIDEIVSKKQKEISEI